MPSMEDLDSTRIGLALMTLTLPPQTSMPESSELKHITLGMRRLDVLKSLAPDFCAM